MHELLLVDNEEDLCEILKSSFEETGHYRVRAFETGETALQYLDDARPNLAIIDVLLPPPVSGLELARHVEKTNTPVLLMSGHPDYVTGAQPLKFPLIAKPFRVSAFIRRVDLLLRETEELRAEWLRTLAQSRQRMKPGEIKPRTPLEWADLWSRMCAEAFGNEDGPANAL